MNYEERVVCFIDILGFKGVIDATVVGGDDVPEEIDRLAGILSLMNEIVEHSNDVDSSHRVTQFSDSIVISFSAREPGQRLYTICSLLWLFLNLTRRGILIRGGVALGKIVHTDSLVFGPAMNEAYRLENEVAVYPRVVVSPEVISSTSGVTGDPYQRENEQELIDSCLTQDSDGQYYVDYIRKADSEMDDPEVDLTIYLAALCDLVKKGVLSPSSSVREKYEWLNNQLLSYLGGCVEYGEDPDAALIFSSLFEECNKNREQLMLNKNQ